MTQQSGRRVFLSHTSELRQHPTSPMSFVAAAEDAVITVGDVPVDMKYFTADERPPAEKCRALVAECDVYVVLAGFRYGSPVREEPDLSYTELEFAAATAAGLPRLGFLLDDSAEGPRSLLIDEQHGARQQAFRQRLLDCGVTVATFTDPHQLKALIQQGLHELRDRQRAATSPTEPDGPSPVGPGATAWNAAAWNIPGRSVDVVGREALFDELRQALADDGQVAAHVALHGIGGMGKSTAAIEYAHLHAADYDIGWWVPAEDSALIPDALAALARALGLAAVTDAADTAVARLNAHLARRSRWLIVFDNAESQGAIRAFLPPGRGHILVTSRNPDWAGTATSVAVLVFDREVSIAVLIARRPDLTREEADAIAERLGDLPQVVEQTARLLADTMLSAADYLDLLSARRADVLGRVPEGTTASAAASWAVLFDRLAADDPAALQLLTFLAWLGREPLPRRHLTALLAAGVNFPSPLAEVVGDPLDVADRLALLVRRGAVLTAGDAVQVHRVPAGLLRDRTKPGSEEADEPSRTHGDEPGWPALAVQALRRTVPEDPWNNPAVWPDWADLLPHVLAVTSPWRVALIRE